MSAIMGEVKSIRVATIVGSRDVLGHIYIVQCSFRIWIASRVLLFQYT